MSPSAPRDFPEIYDSGVMDYGLMNYNLSTPLGTFFPGEGIAIEEGMRDYVKALYGCKDAQGECQAETIKDIDCDIIKSIVLEQNVKSLIAYDKDCEFLRNCGYSEKTRKNKACLFLD